MIPFFHTDGAVGSNKYNYSELNKIIETKKHFYLMTDRTNGFIVIKENCSPALISFLHSLKNQKRSARTQTASASEKEQMSASQWSQEFTGTDLYPEPLFQTYSILNRDEMYKLVKLQWIKLWKLPYFIAVFTAIMLLITALQGGLSSLIISAVTIAIIYIVFLCFPVKLFLNAPDSKAELSFYDSFVYIVFPNATGRYNYRDLYKIYETETNFYIRISRLQIIIVDKENCSPELVQFIRRLQGRLTA